MWASRITSWRQFPLPLLSMRPPWLSFGLEERVWASIQRMDEALQQGDFATMTRMLPSHSRWRLYGQCLPVCAFFDIETDGTPQANPTVASVYSLENGVELFVDGHNLDDVVSALSHHPVWITFGGVRCDEPWLRARFPHLPRPQFHFDLCPFARALGLKGGLKPLEERLGFGRPSHLKGTTGRDAIFLWQRWQDSHDSAALRHLCEYNIYDTIQLRPLADSLFNRALETLADNGAPTPFDPEDGPQKLPAFHRADLLAEIQQCIQRIASY